MIFCKIQKLALEPPALEPPTAVICLCLTMVVSRQELSSVKFGRLAVSEVQSASIKKTSVTDGHGLLFVSNLHKKSPIFSNENA